MEGKVGAVLFPVTGGVVFLPWQDGPFALEELYDRVRCCSWVEGIDVRLSADASMRLRMEMCDAGLVVAKPAHAENPMARQMLASIAGVSVDHTVPLYGSVLVWWPHCYTDNGNAYMQVLPREVMEYAEAISSGLV